MHIHIRLDQSESSFFTLCEVLASESVTVISKLELSGVNGNNRANKEFFMGNLRVAHSFQKHSAVLQVVLEKSQ